MNELAPRMESAIQDQDLPLAHLQLGVRPYNALLEAGFKTVLDVYNGQTTGVIKKKISGAKSLEDIEEALSKFENCLQYNGSTDWERYWEIRPPKTHVIAITSNNLNCLDTNIRNSELGILNLNKACSGLIAVGIDNVGKLVEACRVGLKPVRNFGKKAQNEVIVAMTALSKSISADGDVDWLDFANHCGFEVLPKKSIAPAENISNLSKVCTSILVEQFSERDVRMFKQRLLEKKSEILTLQAIGDVYNLERERVRQIEEKCLDSLRNPILRNDYRGMRFRLRDEFTHLFRSANAHLSEIGVPAWRISDWINELAKFWNVNEKSIQRYDRLILEILGYSKDDTGVPAFDRLIISHQTSRNERDHILATVAALHSLLSSDPKQFGDLEIVSKINKGRNRRIELDDLNSMIELCSSIETIDENTFQLQFSYIRGRANQAIRVLLENGEPLHYRELMREINKRLPDKRRLTNKENLVGQLTADTRLVPIGRSGMWTLTEWEHETRTISEILKDVIESEGMPLEFGEIFEKANEYRSIKESSARMTLDMRTDKFQRVAFRTYALAEWKLKESELNLGRSRVSDMIIDFFNTLKSSSVAFPELRKAVMDATGWKSRVAQGVLISHPLIQIEKVDSRRRTAIFKPNGRTIPTRRARTSDAPRQPDTIRSLATDILSQSPLKEMPLNTVVSRIEKSTGIVRPNIYAALKLSENLEGIAVDGSAFKILRLVNSAKPVIYNVEKIKNNNWRTEALRALEKLNVEDVDICLFMLGRLLDQASKDLLISAETHTQIEVKDGHKTRLQNRIDWMVSKGNFSDSSTLNLLKTERNARGHEPPSQEEREALFRFAPFLSDLYIDYIVLIESRISEYESQSMNIQNR